MRKVTFAVLFTLLFGCTTANIGSKAGENQTQSITVAAGYDVVFRAAAQTASLMKWEISQSDANTGVISAKYEGSLRRWGDEVSILINAVDNGTRITVRSKLGQKPNRDYVKEYLDNLRASL